MPILAPITGNPYCPQENYVCGDGVNTALWNEVADTISFELFTGIDLVHARPNKRVNQGTTQEPIECGFYSYSSASLTTGGVVLRSDYLFEMMPGWEKFRILAQIQLPTGKLTNTNPAPGTVATVDKDFTNIRFKVKNVDQGTESVIAHFFTDEPAWSSYAAANGLPAHGTAAQYVQSIGTSETLINYSVDIPANLQPQGNYSEKAQLVVELMGINTQGVNYIYRVVASGLQFAGIKWIKFSEVIQCQ